MSTSAAQASAFFEEIGPDGAIWTIEDDGGIPAPVGTDGRRAMPFWSKRSWVERIRDCSDAVTLIEHMMQRYRADLGRHLGRVPSEDDCQQALDQQVHRLRVSIGEYS